MPTPSSKDDADGWRALPKPGQTIVKLCDGCGEPPLIIMHGGGGAIHAFQPLKAKFRSALWAIQVTPDTPLETLLGQANFYHQRIKEKQPSGPYRLAAFSASSIIVFAVTRIFERNGDVVSQLSFLDHFPTTFLAPVLGLDVSKKSLAHPTARNEFLDASVSNLLDMTRRDGGGNVPKRMQLASDLSEAYHGRPVSPFIRAFNATLERFLNQIFDFLLSLTVESHLPALPALYAWLQDVRAPVSVYLGSYGILGSIPPEHRNSWHDLHIHRCFPNARIILLKAGHYDILSNDIVIAGLQTGYIARHKL